MNSLKTSAVIYQYFDHNLGISSSAVLYFASLYELKIVEKSFNNYGIHLRVVNPSLCKLSRRRKRVKVLFKASSGEYLCSEDFVSLRNHRIRTYLISNTTINEDRIIDILQKCLLNNGYRIVEKIGRGFSSKYKLR